MPADTGAKPTEIEPLPAFKDTPPGERQALFIKKLKLCAMTMDFSDNASTTKQREKEIKRLNLLEIMDYINTTKGVFNEATFEEITLMISQNLFRALAANQTGAQTAYDPDEDEPQLEASWPHLQYVYEFLLRFVVSNETDPKVRTCMGAGSPSVFVCDESNSSTPTVVMFWSVHNLLSSARTSRSRRSRRTSSILCIHKISSRSTFGSSYLQSNFRLSLNRLGLDGDCELLSISVSCRALTPA